MSYAKAFSIINDVGYDIKAVQAKLTIRIDQMLVMQTPVDEGRARGNWIVSNNSPVIKEYDVVDPNQAMRSSLAQGQAEAKKIVPFSLTFIQNNLPYIQRLNEGWSAQAPSRYIERIIETAVNET